MVILIHMSMTEQTGGLSKRKTGCESQKYHNLLQYGRCGKLLASGYGVKSEWGILS